MKRDLKKWLESEKILERLELKLEEFSDIDDLALEVLDASESFDTASEQLQFIWMEAQKQFLKDLLEDLDNSIDKIFGSKNTIQGSKAQHVAYEESVKQWLYNKYHYLKRKNGV